MEAKKQKLNNGRPSKGLSQSMYCEICKVTCNSHIMFDNHVAGWKHEERIKNLTMVDSKEYIELKKKKVLESGAKVDEVKVCELCNVVCNSLTVFESHCNGQKHRSMVKEQEDDSSDSEEEIILEQQVQPNISNNPPSQSSCRKQNVSYNEKADVDDDLDDYGFYDDGEGGHDDDFLGAHKKKQSRNESNEAEDIPNGKEEEADPGSDPEELTYQAPEFFQFDKIRQQRATFEIL